MQFRPVTPLLPHLTSLAAPLLGLGWMVVLGLAWPLFLAAGGPQGSHQSRRNAATLPASEPGPTAPLAAGLLLVRVELRAGTEGELSDVIVDGRSMGSAAEGLRRLSSELLLRLGRPGAPLPGDVVVELKSDFELRYEHAVSAVAACSGTTDPRTGKFVRFVETVRFEPPTQPRGA